MGFWRLGGFKSFCATGLPFSGTHGALWLGFLRGAGKSDAGWDSLGWRWEQPHGFYSHSWHGYPRGLSTKTAKEGLPLPWRELELGKTTFLNAKVLSFEWLEVLQIWFRPTPWWQDHLVHPPEVKASAKQVIFWEPPDPPVVQGRTCCSECLSHLHFLRLWLKSECSFETDVNIDGVWRWIHTEALILLGRLQEAVEVWNCKVIACYIDSCWTRVFHTPQTCAPAVRNPPENLDSQQRSQHRQGASQYFSPFHCTIDNHLFSLMWYIGCGCCLRMIQNPFRPWWRRTGHLCGRRMKHNFQ